MFAVMMTAPGGLSVFVLALVAAVPIVAVTIAAQSPRVPASAVQLARRFVLACALAVVLAAVAHASDDVVIIDSCRGLGPSDALYWVLGCYLRPWWPF